MNPAANLPDVLLAHQPNCPENILAAWTDLARALLPACGGPETLRDDPVRALRFAGILSLLLMADRVEARILCALADDAALMPPAALLRQAVALRGEALARLEALQNPDSPAAPGNALRQTPQTRPDLTADSAEDAAAGSRPNGKHRAVPVPPQPARTLSRPDRSPAPRQTQTGQPPVHSAPASTEALSPATRPAAGDNTVSTPAAAAPDPAAPDHTASRGAAPPSAPSDRPTPHQAPNPRSNSAPAQAVPDRPTPDPVPSSAHPCASDPRPTPPEPANPVPAAAANVSAAPHDTRPTPLHAELTREAFMAAVRRQLLAPRLTA